MSEHQHPHHPHNNNHHYAPSMASTAYSDDDTSDQSSEVLAEIQKLESILLEQLDKETQRFGSSSASSTSSSLGFEKHGMMATGDATSSVDLDGASSINFSQYLDAQERFEQETNANHDSIDDDDDDDAQSRSSVGGPARSTAQSSAYWSQIMDASTSDIMDNQSCTSLRKELSQIVTPYGHVSQRVQAYEQDTWTTEPTAVALETNAATEQAAGTTTGMYQTGAFAGTDGSVVGTSSVAANSMASNYGIEELTQRTAALSSSSTEDQQSAIASASATLQTPKQQQQQHHREQQNEEQEQAELLSQTQKIKSLLQNLESQLTQVSSVAKIMGSSSSSSSSSSSNSKSEGQSEAAAQMTTTNTTTNKNVTAVVPALEIQNSIRSLSFLEDTLRNSVFRPGVGGSNTTIDEDDEKSTATSASSASVVHSRNRLNKIRQKLWGGAANSPAVVKHNNSSKNNSSRRQEGVSDHYFAGIEEGFDENDDDDVDNASVVGQVSTDILHYPNTSKTEETTTCFPKPKEERNIRPRDDYFSAAYQNAFACSSAYQLDVPEPGTATISSTPNQAGGKNYYYYYPPPEQASLPNVACCQIPPVERLMTVLKRLEVKVAKCHVNHLQRKRQQQRQQRQGSSRFPDGAILQQYELSNLDLSNPAKAERYHDL
ncbi:unnamed protein product [Cylindrotheca closterium]|uniref:Uncharacterized protein n=1 Tax=Cylindrotheca closterium TaxID=2856 RepID=A0AAD2CKL2_9STRA|nr:unnamed protein product [Cylindrotheca closterium]